MAKQEEQITYLSPPPRIRGNSQQIGQAAALAGQITNQAQSVASTGQNMSQPTSQASPSAQPTRPNTIASTDAHTYKEPLVIKNSLLRAFLVLAIICILISLIKFIAKQFSETLGTNQIYSTIWLVLVRVDSVAAIGRVICIIFAAAATVIRVLNPHPYNTRAVVFSWVSALLTLLALLIFR